MLTLDEWGEVVSRAIEAGAFDDLQPRTGSPNDSDSGHAENALLAFARAEEIAGPAPAGVKLSNGWGSSVRAYGRGRLRRLVGRWFLVFPSQKAATRAATGSPVGNYSTDLLHAFDGPHRGR